MAATLLEGHTDAHAATIRINREEALRGGRGVHSSQHFGQRP
jgi:hypothetical protein